ncbi:phage gp6-like head-tail connector protein [Streptomyces chartreusis]|uniref:phage gp6-like head-tail connector protein n=1 Tax=Streptomyces chartreusis TaxID=1969 RepID=UPI003714D1F6
MANEYVTLDELKAQLEIPLDDTTRDADLNRARASASRGIDNTTGRRFWLDPDPVARTYRLTGRVVCDDDGDLLLVDDIGDITGMTVERGSGGSFTAVTGYETSPDNALADGDAITGIRLVNGRWGSATTRVRVTAKFGWPTVPEDIKQAAIIQASRLFKRAGSPEGVIGSSEWGVVRLSRRDPDVWALIEPYILPGFG